MKIRSVEPPLALPGGIVRIEVEGLKDPSQVEVRMGAVMAEVLGASGTAVTVRVPVQAGSGVAICQADEDQARLRIGRVLLPEMQPVSNPAVDDDGIVYVTFSGARGEKVPFGVYRVNREGRSEPFLAEIMNPTGLALGPDQCLYVSSRHTGMVYRSTMDKQVEEFAEGLGLPTGLVFDSEGNLFVGDRSGQVHKVTAQGTASVHCRLEPSVSAYHLAIDPQDRLYLTGPTFSTQDSIYRISRSGEIETLFRGLGRPQGLAFDQEGRLEVAASYRGRKGIFRLQDGSLQWSLAGPMLVGLAYDLRRSLLYLVDHANLYQIEI